MNILDDILNWILNWIIFKRYSMVEWIIKIYCPGLVGLFVCLFVCLSVWQMSLFVQGLSWPCLLLLNIHKLCLFVYLFVCLFVCLAVCLFGKCLCLYSCCHGRASCCWIFTSSTASSFLCSNVLQPRATVSSWLKKYVWNLTTHSPPVVLLNFLLHRGKDQGFQGTLYMHKWQRIWFSLTQCALHFQKTLMNQLNDIESQVFGLCFNEMEAGWNKFRPNRLADIF